MSRATIAVVVAALLMPCGTLLAQVGAAAQPGLRLRFAADTLELRVPPQLQPGGILTPRTTPEELARSWVAQLRLVIDAQRARRRHELLLQSVGLRREPARPAIPRPEAVAQPAAEQVGREQQPPLGSLAQFADLGVDLNARIELVFDQLRNARCTAADAFNVASGCVGGFPTPTLQPRFDVRSSGIVGDRVHLDVDFDTEREFNANNSIIVYYQGLEDEILRRVDVGTVTFQAPPSRFITTGIPSNSFGVQAEAQLGALNFRSIAAQQKGSAVRVREFTVGEAATQPVDFEARDLDFEAGRFFFVVNPIDLPGYPAVDILNINVAALPPALQLDAVRVYRLRAQSGQVQDNPNLGGIDAVAVRFDGPQRVGPFSWELLIEGRDYYLDPSATWFALNTRVGTQDFLAVSYVTTSGDTIGTFPAVNGVSDTLELVYEPRRGADVPTFPYEMRNAYRIGSGEMDRGTTSVSVLVNNSETPLDGRGTYLSRLGVALQTDASTVDEFNRLFPRIRDPGGGAPVRDLFLVFPHLTPFADSSRLAVGERNDSLYRTPTYLRQSQGPPPKFTLAVHYEAGGAGTQTVLNLGAIQVRVGSERIYSGERQLTRGRDYEIDYALGQLTFLNPDSLFQGPTQIRAEYEENQLFDDAPRSILGFSSSYSLGKTGDIHAIGIFQSERSVSNRPLLGFEPQALFIGGLSTELHFRPLGITRFLDGLPLLNTTVPSALDIDGEVAVSLPNSNRSGVAYVEDFETAPSTRVNLSEGAFQLAAAPTSGRGLPLEYLDASGNFDPGQAVPLVWQNLIRSSTGGLVQFTARDIDSTIVLSGSGVSIETALWLTLKPDTVGGVPDGITGAPRWFRPHTVGPRWRSIVQPLGGGSGVGIDLSRVEFFDFWVLEDASRLARQQGAYLVFDFGTVFEDAVGFGPTSFSPAGADTSFDGFQLIGTGRLDSEKDPLTNVYNAQFDEVGILGDLLDSIVDTQSGTVIREFPTCDLRTFTDISAFPLGNLLARCSRGNGALNTEDLDGDNRLDLNVGTTQEDFFRYVFPVGDDRHFVREGGSYTDFDGGQWTWRLYRVPFREDTVQVGRPNITQIRSLRTTVVAPDQAGVAQEFSLALARMQFVGAPWIKRSETPIAGLSGMRGEPRGEVLVSVITTQDLELGYESPPGVIDQPPRSDLDLTFGSVEVNETSLRILVKDLRAGERGEALTRFTNTADKNFLQYRNLRVWARGRDVGWEEGDLEFLLKVGRDEDNFYMYRTQARSVSWEPEVVVDITRWTQLRVQIENRWLSGAPPSGAAECGGDSTAYVACDGPYFIQVRDPGTSPPNLARVSEVAVGVFRAQESTTIEQAELWVDDIRLTDVIDDAGVAAAVDIRLAAADVAQLSVGYSSVSDRFRQLEEEPSYITDRSLRLGLGLNLDKFLPQSWGLSMPFQVRHARTDADPFYVSETDVRADALADLRQPGSAVTDLEVGLRRVRRGTSLVERVLLDPVSVRVRSSSGSSTTSLSEASTKNRQLHADYSTAPRPKTVRVVPDFIVDLVDALPGFISNSEFANALRGSRFRWNPQRLRFSSTLTDNSTQRTVFRVPVELPSDTTTRVLPSIRHLWRNAAELDLRPFSTFGLSASYESTRDLQDYGDSTAIGDYLGGLSGDFLGMNAGFERTRRITTGMDLSPVLSAWLRPRFLFSSSFLFNRDPNAPAPDTIMGIFRTPQSTTNSRVRELGATVDLARLFRGIFGDSSLPATVMGGLLPADFSHVRELRSNFNDITFIPGLKYQLALGGLDEFRTQGGLLATSTGEITGLTLTAGARLPLGTQVRISYRKGGNRVWLARSGVQERNEQKSLEWPSLVASWVYTPGDRLRNVISSISAQFEYRTVERATFQPITDPLPQSGAGAGIGMQGPRWTEDYTRSLAPRLTIIWPAGVSTSGSYASTRNRLLTSGNTRNTDQVDWNGSLGFGFRPPSDLFGSRNEIRTTVSFTDSQRAVCMMTTGSSECRTVSDSHRRVLDIRMDAGLSETLRGGATFSYVLNELRHTSERLSQVVFSIYIDYRFFAGEIR
ncbi:MAG: cell surface protein SprA [Gemmatimonadota bacterium]|nr:MAG: cell surface protein SprA [Gemmatimonadota bacterium]